MILIIVNKYNRLVMKKSVFSLLLGLCILQGGQHAIAQNDDEPIPDYFVELRELIPTLHLELRYFSENNFVGRVIDGYHEEKVFMTKEAASALSNVQNEFAVFGLGLKVFDAYRPQSAVDHFVRWAEDLNDNKMKQVFYPFVAKEILFDEGYISARSGHSRGSSIDLTLIDSQTGEELDMGTPWDFFDPSSWPSYQEISAQARANRNLLSAVMTKHGFAAIRTEWWHFNLEDEPFPNTYFDFPVK
ncbi:MAG: M15 family metallopeptidase [Gammaproteobacteria bacterium]|nr:M15 family metallopeptidase [Gammaproteobacteria bacterium]